MPVVISVEHLSKTYRLGQIGTGTFANDLKLWWAKMRGKPNPLLRVGEVDHGNRDGETIWALKDVSFTVEQGEVLGIIGRNGAGKSTVLKILSRVTAPTFGRIRVKGRVASLLEVGTGFHPELTGRENIYLNGAILGMNKAEVARKFDEIVEFSGVEKFIDTPVKRYSSGMYVRLAFAVAAHLEPEILVVDEVLAVGDAEFQKKCIGKMSDVAGQGRTILFVSHHMASIRTLCPRTVLMQSGVVAMDGESHDVISHYLGTKNETEAVDLKNLSDRGGNGNLRFTKVRFLNKLHEEVDRIISGEELTIELDYKVFGPVYDNSMTISVILKDRLGTPVAQFISDEMGAKFEPFHDTGTVRIQIPRFLLRGGDYHLRLFASSPDTGIESAHDVVDNAAVIHVYPGDFWKSGKVNRLGSYAIIDATMGNSPYS